MSINHCDHGEALAEKLLQGKPAFEILEAPDAGKVLHFRLTGWMMLAPCCLEIHVEEMRDLGWTRIILMIMQRGMKSSNAGREHFNLPADLDLGSHPYRPLTASSHQVCPVKRLQGAGYHSISQCHRNFVVISRASFCVAQTDWVFVLFTRH